MTDRHAGYIVILEENIRSDDAEWTINALKMVKGVADVKPVLGNYAQDIAESRRDELWREILREILRSGPGSGQ